MAMREELLRIAEHLSEAELEALLDYARFLMSEVDEEPLSEPERLAVAEAKEERRRGGGEPWEKVKRELGLL